MNRLSSLMCMLIRLAVMLFVSVVTCPIETGTSLSFMMKINFNLCNRNLCKFIM